jgi:hypothetical protein
MDEFPEARNSPPADSMVKSPTTVLITGHFFNKMSRVLQKTAELLPSPAAVLA